MHPFLCRLFKTAPKSKASKPRKARPAVEILEDRLVPAAIPPFTHFGPNDLMLPNADATSTGFDMQAPSSTCPPLATVAGTAAGSAPAGNPMSSNPVNYYNGVVQISNSDLLSNGFGQPWGQTRSWSNGAGFSNNSRNGNGWVNAELPSLSFYSDVSATPSAAAEMVVLIENANQARFYELNGSNYESPYFDQSILTFDGTNHKYILRDGTGATLQFFDFSTTWPAAQRGQFDRKLDAYGNSTIATVNVLTGLTTEVQQSDGTNTVSFVYTYTSSGPTLIENVTMRQKVGAGSWTSIRQVDYTYYSNGDAGGKDGDLKFATIKDGSGNALDTLYYRYYVSDGPSGYAGGLKYVFNADSYARLAGLYPSTDPDTLDEVDIAPFADNYFEYVDNRVSLETAQAQGCCNGGLGTFEFEYEFSENSVGFNSWAVKAEETLPDGNKNIVYTNAHGQVMLKVYQDTGSGQKWGTFYRYDSQGRIVFMADSAAVDMTQSLATYEAYSDLLNLQTGGSAYLGSGGDYQYLSNSAGAITVYSYGSSTSATTSTPGNVLGRTSAVAIYNGESALAISQSATQYLAVTAGSNTIYLVDNVTVYRETNGTGAATTYYDYTFFSGTLQVQSLVTTYPAVSTAQNGPNSASTETVFFDAYGRPIWMKDADGYFSYTAYDSMTGAVVKSISDVNTSNTGDFANLPSGWTTLMGAGLHLITQFQVDQLGRTTKITDPTSRVTYFVYKDLDHEVRTYPGWNSTSHTPTGPTIVSRVNREENNGTTLFGYTESITMSATPALNGSNLPTGTESIGSIKSLSRSYWNSAGQVAATDQYFSDSGLTYSTDIAPGTSGVNYLRTAISYDDRGRVNRTVAPNGTIRRTIYDGLGRAVSEWVGSDDTPTSGTWPTNTAGTNMVKIREYEFDGGEVGNGNLTKVIEYPGGGGANMRTDSLYDWRNRLTATKSGVEATETGPAAGNVNRPLTVFTYDNLSQVIQTDIYDGDNQSLSSPSSGNLRSRTLTYFDEEGKIYRTVQRGVDQSSGSVNGTLTYDTFYDRRGNVVKTTDPLGTPVTYTYDGASRHIATIDSLGTTTNVYDSAGRVTVVRDHFNRPTTYTYDLASRQTKVEVPLDATHTAITTTTYNAAGMVGAVTDPNNHTTSYTYDLLGRVRTITNALSQTTTYAYDGAGSLGHLASITEPTNARTTYNYDAWGRHVSTTDANSHTSTLTYDYLGRVIATADGLGNATTVAYDVAGRRVTVSNPLTRVTTSTYDALGRVVSIVAPIDGSTTSTTSTSYDSFGRVLATSDANGSKTTYTYDAAGRMLTLRDPNNNVTTFTYDGNGNQLSATDPLGQTSTFAYDAAGRLTATTDRNGRSRTLSYDYAGRLIGELWKNSSAATVDTLTFTYDAAGNQLTAANQYGAYTLSYDAVNRVTESSQPSGFVMEFDYDSAGRRLSVSDSQSGYESSTYDGVGNLSGRTLQLGLYQELRATFAYDAANRVTGMTNPSSRTTFTYDNNGYVTDIEVRDGGGVLRRTFEYAYDYSGRMTWDSIDSVETTYTYDLAGQIVGEESTFNSVLTTYTYDAAGNRTMSGYTTGAANQITSDGTWDFAYDDEGNMTEKESVTSPLKWVYSYDNLNHLAKAERLTNGTDVDLSLEYRYDAWGNRITRLIDGDGTGMGNPVVTQFVQDGWDPMKMGGVGLSRFEVAAELTNDGTVITRYSRDSRIDGVLGRLSSANDSLYTITDPQGTVYDILDISGNFVDSLDYDAFGNIRYESWTPDLRGTYAWTGRELEVETGLQYNRARYYDATIGRWLSQDPMGFAAGDSNLYRYVKNAPTNYLDPSGYWSRPASPSGKLDVLGDFLDYTRDIKDQIAKDIADLSSERSKYIFEITATSLVDFWKGSKVVDVRGREITDGARELTPSDAIKAIGSGLVKSIPADVRADFTDLVKALSSDPSIPKQYKVAGGLLMVGAGGALFFQDDKLTKRIGQIKVPFHYNIEIPIEKILGGEGDTRIDCPLSGDIGVGQKMITSTFYFKIGPNGKLGVSPTIHREGKSYKPSGLLNLELKY